jgi:hypothetical protein
MSPEMARRNRIIDTGRAHLRGLVLQHARDLGLSAGGYTSAVERLTEMVFPQRGNQALSRKAVYCWVITVLLREFRGQMPLHEWVLLLVGKRTAANTGLSENEQVFVWDRVALVYQFQPEIILSRPTPPQKISITIWDPTIRPFKWDTASYGRSATVELGSAFGRLLLPNSVNEAIELKQTGRGTLTFVGVYPAEKMITFNTTSDKRVELRFTFAEDMGSSANPAIMSA